jgi:hypothetical protein
MILRQAPENGSFKMAERRDMIINDTKSAELTAAEELKLRKVAEDGGSYLAMINGPGWKDLLDKFINRRISQERYLIAKSEDLADTRAAQKELFDLLQFVSKRVEDGQKAFERLHSSK